jgi:hypothetical protein
MSGFQECDPGLRLMAGAAQLVELVLQRADLRGSTKPAISATSASG